MKELTNEQKIEIAKEVLPEVLDNMDYDELAKFFLLQSGRMCEDINASEMELSIEAKIRCAWYRISGKINLEEI